MKAVISVANVTTGVGKMTTAVHLAAELALRGYDTVLIDADPQAEATARLVEPEAVRFSLADILHEPVRSRPFFLGERPISFAEVLAPTSLMSLHLAPSTIRLAAVEGEFPLASDAINWHLRSLDTPCDFAVIDTPSSLGPISAACLSASTHLLVPVAPRGQGVTGLRHLIEGVDVVRGLDELKLLGVVCNLFDYRSRSSGEFYEALKREWGGQVFETIIHRDNLVEGCAGRRMPVQALAPESAAATLYSQLADEAAPRLTGAPRAGRAAGRRTVKILLAEDDRLVMSTVRDVLKMEGWEVVGCENGARALSEIEGEERFDLIVTDYEMPGVNGLELARATRTLGHRRGTPIIMLTASPVEREARTAGVVLFLAKPEGIGRLVEAIKVLLGG
jgi:chromosome partitioning protein